MEFNGHAPAVLDDKQALHHDEVVVSMVDTKVLKGVATEQLAVFQSFAEKDDEWKAAKTKKLLRKLDLRILTVLGLMYLLNILDRSNLSQARLGGLEKDLKMKGTDFNFVTSILFVGYLFMQLPSNLILAKTRPSIYLGCVMTIWGAVSCAQAAVKSFKGLVVCRIFLGVTEAPFFPGAIMLLSSFYRREELAHRIAIFYSGNALANMFGGLLAAAVLSNLEGAHGIQGWRWLFIIEGVITIGVALSATIILPDFPGNTKWLTEEERQFAQWRLVSDANEADDQDAVTIWEGLKLALKDYRLYLFILLQHMSILSTSFGYFFPSIVKTLGYGKIETLLLTVPVWFFAFIVSLLVTYLSSRISNRSYPIICLVLIGLIGNVIAFSTTRTGPRFFAMFLMPMAQPAYQIILAWIANSFIRPLVKRSASIAICNMIANCASIYGAYMYPSSDAPQYKAGGAATAGVCGAMALLTLAIRFVLARENKKLEKADLLDEEAPEERRDGVEQRAKGFRYVL